MSDLMREEFEAWWSSTPILGENKRTIAEKAWQDSRECLVIELPESVTNSGTAYIETIRAFIEKQGIKTK